MDNEEWELVIWRQGMENATKEKKDVLPKETICTVLHITNTRSQKKATRKWTQMARDGEHINMD